MNSLKRPFLTLCVIPTVIASALIGLYFSGIPMLQYLVSPDIGGNGFSGSDHEVQDREFGLLENLQNLYLLVIIVTCVIGSRTHPFVWIRRLLFVGCFAGVFLFLEEIDYGRHILEGFFGHDVKLPEERNIHNKDGALKVMKKIMDAFVLLFFVAFPITAAFMPNLKIRFRWIVPGLWYAAAAILSKGHSELSRLFDANTNLAFHPLDNNLSEFRELTFYYILMIYVFDIAILRGKPSDLLKS